MSSDLTKIIIAGAGIAGPVLAIFLKARGYEPIVYERSKERTDAGLSLVLQPNGLRILSGIPDFVQHIPGQPIATLTSFSTLDASPGLLHTSSLPSLLPKLLNLDHGLGMLAVSQSKFHAYILERAEAAGVEIHWGKRVIDVVQLENSTGTDEDAEEKVKVVFEDGTSDEASWVIGCDGLHSGVRIALFGKEAADYTGVSQTGGISPTPQVLAKSATMANFYGLGAHLIAYPISSTHTSWALTIPEAELKETWQAADKTTQEKIQTSPYAQWNDGAGELIRTTEKLVKYGLFDRPELKTWHRGRVVLLGDAAHPTSPHLGQGANQAFEDISTLIRLLDAHNPDRAPPSALGLTSIFAEFERIRITVSSEMVKGARERGESRVLGSEERCKARNEAIRQAGDSELVKVYSKIFGADEKFAEMLKALTKNQTK